LPVEPVVLSRFVFEQRASKKEMETSKMNRMENKFNFINKVCIKTNLPVVHFQ
jgi:hypothetical protein